MIVLNGETRFDSDSVRFLFNIAVNFQVEFILVRFDHEKKKVQLVLKAHQLLPVLMEPEHQNPE